MERRSFLVLGAAAIGLSGCTLGDPDRVDPSPPGQTSPPADEDAGVRASVAASEVALIASYRAAIRARPELAERLEPLLAHHVAHLARVSPEAAPPTPTDSPGTARPDRSPTGTAEAPATPTPLATVEALAEAEAQAQAQRTDACDSARSPGLARDICLIAASEAQHIEVLTRLARTLGT